MVSTRLAGYLAYFEQLALQPLNHWNGFYVTKLENTGFGLRYQIAFACYALAAICLHPDTTPDEQDRARKAMAALIDRMLQRRVWAYWSIRVDQYNLTADPVAQANADYSGHLAMMLGLYRLVGGDTQYDESFTLRWSPDECFFYTHHSLVQGLWEQMMSHEQHGVDSEPGRVHVTSMCHILWANVLHDTISGTDYATANQIWVDFLRERLVQRGPRLIGNGIFSPYYTRRMRLLSPMSMSFVDAWVLAFLQPLYPDLVDELVSRFLRTIKIVPGTAAPEHQQAYVPWARVWESRELADQTHATAFGYILTVELAEDTLATALRNYAEQQYMPTEEDSRRYYGGGLSEVYTTALLALGEAGGLSNICARMNELTQLNQDHTTQSDHSVHHKELEDLEDLETHTPDPPHTNGTIKSSPTQHESVDP